jgi:hypothetical protein
MSILKRFAQLLAIVSFAFCSPIFAQAQSDTNNLFTLQSDLDEPRGVCIDIPGFRATIDLNVPVVAHTCKPNPDAREDMLFRLDFPRAGNIYNAEYQVCLDTVETLERGSVYVRPCSNSDTQNFVRGENGELRPFGSGLCVAVSPSPWHPAVLAGVVPELGVTFVAKAMSLAPCDEVAAELKNWNFNQ